MLISLLGYMGIGLIWGWWIGSLSGKITRPLFDGMAAGAATLMFALGASYLSDMTQGTVLFPLFRCLEQADDILILKL